MSENDFMEKHKAKVENYSYLEWKRYAINRAARANAIGFKAHTENTELSEKDKFRITEALLTANFAANMATHVLAKVDFDLSHGEKKNV